MKLRTTLLNGWLAALLCFGMLPVLSPAESAARAGIAFVPSGTSSVSSIFDNSGTSSVFDNNGASNVGAAAVIDDAGTYKMWYTYGSTNFTIRGTTASIGYATSPDRVTWTRQAATVLTGNLTWDASGVGAPAVIKDGSVYKMWYTGGKTDGSIKGTVPVIGYATSDDGITWTKNASPVLTGTVATWDANGVGAPSVIKDGSVYKMWYSGGTTDDTVSGTHPAIGYATSTNGTSWTKNASPVLQKSGQSWDSSGVAVASVVKVSDTLYYMWYTGATGYTLQNAGAIGQATSTNGITWVAQSAPIMQKSTTFQANGVAAPAVTRSGSSYHMWYTGIDANKNPSIGFASASFAPQVLATSPSANATNVAVNTLVMATFDKAMNPATINTASFRLANGGPVTGVVTVSADNRTATFTPGANLAYNTLYTANLTTAITDASGNALASNKGWIFTTAAPTGQAPVNLRSADSYAVLAGSTVTSTGATIVNGDLGVSPGTAVVGFPPGIVNGTIHAGDATAAQAQLDLTTAYNDAAGRTVGAVTVAGNIGGQTLTPGLYKSTSTLAISSGDLTLDAQGNANAVFIFQVASTLTTTSDRQVILSGGAKAANIYWQVGTSATLGTTSIFRGTILADQSITLNTGATLDGRALARIGAVTLDGNAVTKPVVGADITPPTVVGTSPLNNATNVPVNTVVTANFSEAMNAATINTASFRLANGGPVTGVVTVSADNRTATFTPSANLAYNRSYTANLTIAITDLAGNPLAAPYTWSFTTGIEPVATLSGQPVGLVNYNSANITVGGTDITHYKFKMDTGNYSAERTVSQIIALTGLPEGPRILYVLGRNAAGTYQITPTTATWKVDTTPPTVASTTPTDNATNVAINIVVSANFNEAIRTASINSGSFTLYRGATQVSGNVALSADNLSATFTPTANLAYNTLYTANLTTFVKDLAGNAMVAPYTWRFTTTAEPQVILSGQPVGLVNYNSANITVGGPDVTAYQYKLDGGSYGAETPVSQLIMLTGLSDGNHTVLVLGRNAAGTWQFTPTTASWKVDTTPPTVTTTTPSNNATNVPVNTVVTANFNEVMRSGSITTGRFTLYRVGVGPVNGVVTVSADNLSATFTPSANLASNQSYTANLTTAIADLAGNPMASPYTWSFTTETVLDTTPPYVVSTVPTDNATGVSVNTVVVATFSEVIKASTVTATSFYILSGSTPVAGTVTVSTDNLSATFTPSANLNYSSNYIATLTTDITDLAGNRLLGLGGQSFSQTIKVQSLVWSVPVTVSTPTQGSNPSLALAIDTTATNGFDDAFDIPHAPAAPGTMLDAYFPLVGGIPFNKLDKDFRGQAATVVWTLVLGPTTDGTTTESITV
ncbi:MAG: hypothetical protein HW402_932, partial [Dehalococcoidales bacterium]|nr:hypothetical protein [Dehalococcoidales bacterium]